jgi:hypothetical protein
MGGRKKVIGEMTAVEEEEDEEEALMALYEHRFKEVQHLRDRLDFYESQVLFSFHFYNFEGFILPLESLLICKTQSTSFSLMALFLGGMSFVGTVLIFVLFFFLIRLLCESY